MGPGGNSIRTRLHFVHTPGSVGSRDQEQAQEWTLVGSRDQERALVGSRDQEQTLVGSRDQEWAQERTLVGSRDQEQTLVGSRDQERAQERTLVGSRDQERAQERTLVGSPDQERTLVGSRDQERTLVGSRDQERAQERTLVGSRDQEQTLVGSRDQERTLVGSPDQERAQERTLVGSPDQERAQERTPVGSPDQERTLVGSPDQERAQERTLVGSPDQERAQERTLVGSPDQERTLVGSPDQERAQEQTLVGSPDQERAQERTLWAHGTRSGLCGLTGPGAGSRADSVGSRDGAGSGVDSVMATMASRTTGLELTGDMPAARTDLMGGSFSLSTSLGIPGCTAALTAVTRGTAALSAATGGAVASSPTTWGTPATSAGGRAKDSTNCPNVRWSSPRILHQLRGSSRALLKRSLRAASLYPHPSASPLNSTANLLTSFPCWRQELRASNWRMRWNRGLEIVAGGGRPKPLLCWVLILADPFCHERDKVEDSSAEESGCLIIKLNKRTKKHPEGEKTSRQAKDWCTVKHDTLYQRYTKDNGSAQDCRHQEAK